MATAAKPARSPSGASRTSGLTKKQRYERLRGQLEQDRSSFLSHWKDLNDYILPRRGRFFVTDINRGERRSQHIVDSTATFAARTLQAGMMSGVTSPARRWFRLTTPDPELAEQQDVKVWLDQVGQRIDTVFLRSNLYNALPIVYGDLGVFGTAAMGVLEDDESIIRCYPYPIGSYYIAADARGDIRVFFREFRMTVRQLVEQFGEENLTTATKAKWKNAQTEVWVDVCHVIAPNADYDRKKLESKHKQFANCYYERGNNEEIYLEESGFDEFPVLVPRWEVTGEDTWATNCPGMTTLGDIKQLQLGERRGMQAIEKMVNPPMSAPSALRSGKASILSGDITYLDVREGQQGFQPVYQIDPKINELEGKQQQVRLRIQRGFFEDLFLMLAQSDRREITAREIDERHEEKLLALGPVLEQLNQDLLDPLIDRTFAIMLRKGLIPDAPDALQGMPLKVEYISVMAQAQARIGVGGLEQFAGFVSQMATIDPSVLDKVNRDEMIDDYGRMTGVSPKIIVSDEDVAQVRQARAEQQKAKAQAELLASSADSAVKLSQADTTKPSLLTGLLSNAPSQLGGAAAA